MGPKWGRNNDQLTCMDSERLVPLINTDDFLESIKDDAEKRFVTLSYDKRKRKISVPKRKI